MNDDQKDHKTKPCIVFFISLVVKFWIKLTRFFSVNANVFCPAGLKNALEYVLKCTCLWIEVYSCVSLRKEIQ